MCVGCCVVGVLGGGCSVTDNARESLCEFHDDAQEWVAIVNEKPRGAPPVFGSSVVLKHVERLIETGRRLSPETCAKCAQLVKSLKAGELLG